MAFSATWNRKPVATNRALLGTAPDPAHSVVSAHDQEYSANYPRPESWVSTTPVSGAVAGMEDETSVYTLPQSVIGGPVDYTPVDHTTGDGVGAGLKPGESEDQNASWRETDYNATAARRWNAPGVVDYENVAERLQEAEPIGQMGSPQTVALHVGTNKESYPNTSTGHRIHRWRDRVFWRETYTTDHRPMYVPNAFNTEVNRAPGTGGYVSPYPQQGHVNTVMEKPPQLRRPPVPWGSAVTMDGMTDPMVYADPPLDVWGQ